MKHIFFSGIGGTGIGPLALIAHQAGFNVSGSDKQNSDYIAYLQKKGISAIHIDQTEENIKNIHQENPIDWFVYSSAIEKEQIDNPELLFVREHSIKHSKRDAFINEILKEQQLELIAIAGTHGKTTTTAMMVWLFKELGVPVSYSVGAKLSFGEMGEFDKRAKYFVYEADEYDRNFLQFEPEIAIIPGIDYDHPDIYPTRESYYEAFVEFITKSNEVFAHKEDVKRIGMSAYESSIQESDFSLLGKVNRMNAQLVVEAMHMISNVPIERLINIMNSFPGVSRRFEKISHNVYSDYAHTPEKIKGALQLARELNGDKVVVVYEGLHNTRQHFIQNELKELFKGIKKLYVVPSYLAREDKSLEMLTPEKLVSVMNKPQDRVPSNLTEELKDSLKQHASNGDVVLCLSAGGGGSLDEWLRREFK